MRLKVLLALHISSENSIHELYFIPLYWMSCARFPFQSMKTVKSRFDFHRARVFFSRRNTLLSHRRSTFKIRTIVCMQIICFLYALFPCATASSICSIGQALSEKASVYRFSTSSLIETYRCHVSDDTSPAQHEFDFTWNLRNGKSKNVYHLSTLLLTRVACHTYALE